MGVVTAGAPPDLLAQPDVDDLDLARVLYALSDPVRLSIVRQLTRDGPCACVALDVEVAKSTATNHFRILRESGVISQCAEGTSRVNTVRAADLERRFPGVLSSVLGAL